MGKFFTHSVADFFFKKFPTFPVFGTWLLFLFFLNFGGIQMAGQNAIEISSPETNPTSQNPIPIKIQFSNAVEELSIPQFTVSNGNLENLVRLNPEYGYNKGVSDTLETFNVNGYPPNIDNAVVAIASIDCDTLLYLTYGNGVKKYIKNTKTVTTFIPGSEFKTPFDIAVNSKGEIYVADKEALQVKIYNASGVRINTIGNGDIGNSHNNFYGPTGLAIDGQDRVYVADTYPGIYEEDGIPDDLDRVKIYDNNEQFIAEFTEQQSGIKDPYRIAVDKNGNIYVSDAGGTNGRVLVFDASFNLIDIIAGPTDKLGAPGSVVIDKNGYVYIVDYQNDLSFTDIFNNPINLIGKFTDIKSTSYHVNVYSPAPDFTYITEFSDDLNLPVDININQGQQILVNNLKLSGETILDVNFEFTLKQFDRLDNFTADLVPDGAGEVTVSLNVDEENIHYFFECAPLTSAEFSITYEPKTPEISCKPATIYLNEQGVAKLDPKQIFDGDPNASNIEDISASKIEFTCEDIGENEVTLTVKFDDGTEATCKATVTVIDNMKPTVKCIDPGQEFTMVNGEVIISIDDIDAGSTDNCDIQSRTIFKDTFTSPGEKEVTLTVIDVNGNEKQCTTTILVVEEENSPPKFENCPQEDIIKETDPGKCGAIVTFEKPTATDDNNNVTITRTDDGPKTGEIFPTGTTTVTFEADDGENEPVICSFDIVVTDNEKPVKTNCPGDITKIIPANQDAVMVEFSQPAFSDNCTDVTIEQTAGPASGSEFEVGATEIEFTATDASGNKETCSFMVTVTQNDGNLPPVFTSCPENINTTNDSGKCGAVVNFDFPTATDDGDPISVTRIDDGPKLDDLFPVGTTKVVFQADDGVNPPVTCSFKVVVADDEDPVITSCPGDQTEGYNVENGLLLPNYTSQVMATDNCPFMDVVQSPSPNTIISEDTPITMTATDLAGNTTTCQFMVFLTVGETFNITCPGDQTEILDEACGYVIPDYTKVIKEEFPNAEVTQSVRIGEIISKQTTEITLTATLNGETDTCTFTLTLIDNIFPEIECPGNQVVKYDPNQGYALLDYTGLASLADNCEVVRVEQSPVAGTIIHEDTEITISLTDAYGNTDSCSFMVLLSNGEEALEISCPDDQTENLNENCQFVVPDYREMAQTSNSEAVIAQSPKPGETINQNTSVQLTATLGEEMVTCSFQLVLEDNIAPTSICASEITLQLNENGIANLAAEDVDNGSSDNCGIESLQIDKTTFTENDIGENTVTLIVTDAAGNSSSCTTSVIVEPNGYNNDFACKESIVLELEGNGEAKLNPEDLFYGDGSNYTYSVNKESFTCTDLGENTVIFTYSGPDGEGSCEIEVIVEDPNNYCVEGPVGPSGPGSFVIVYPNPGNGMVKIAVSNDIGLTKAEVFDMRGRLLYMKEFVNNIHGNYKLDIRNVQSGVYLIKLYGEDEIFYERVIISTF